MKALTLKQGLNTFNLFFITTFLVLALYSALGQQVFPYVSQYRADIERYLSDQLDSDVSIRTLSGDMSILTPSIHLEGVTLSASDDQTIPSLSIAAIDAILDPQASLLNLAPVFKSVRISGLSINVSDNKSGNKQGDNSALIQSFIEILLLQQHLELNNVTVEFANEDSSERLHLNNLSMTGDGFHRLMTGSITFGSDNKIKAGLRLYSEGSPYNLDEFYARGVLDLPKVDVDHWLEKITDVSIFDDFSASSQLSVEFQNGLLNYAKLNLASRTVAVPDVKTFKNISTEIWLKQNNVDTWTVWLEDSSFSIDSKKWQLEGLALKLSKTLSGNRWHSFIQQADIEQTYELINSLELIPEVVDGIYQDLSPSGGVNNFNIIIQQDNTSDAPMAITLAGELKGVSTKAHNSIPGINNVTGVIAAGKDSGRVQFEGADIELSFPELYTNSFQITQGKGQVDWIIQDDGFKILGNGLDLQLPGIKSLKGGFDVVVPKQSSPNTGTFELNLSTSGTDILSHPVLVPKVAPKSLNTWLTTALLGGEISSGQFYFYDSFSSKASDPVLELYLDAKDGELAYLEDWPVIENINGQVFVDNNDVYGKFVSANSLGGQLSNAQIVFKSEPSEYLWIGSGVTGSSDSMFSYFKTTPLKDLVGNVFSEWNMQGRQTTKLGLKIPLVDDIEHLKADVETVVSKTELDLGDVGLAINDISGSVRYTTSTGLTSPKLSASLWGDDLSAKISTVMHGRDMNTDIHFSGELDTSDLKSWLKLSLLEPISGQSQAEGHVMIDTRENGFTGLRFESDLNGVSIDLPGEFKKEKKVKVPLSGSVELGKAQILKLAYDERVNLAMALEQGELVSGQVFLGKTEAYIPSESGVEISGHIEEINLDEWIDTWKEIEQSPYASSKNISATNDATGENASNPLRLVDISTDTFKYGEFKFEQVKSTIKQNNNIWTFNIDAPVAKGIVNLKSNEPIDVDLEYVHWPMLSQEEDSEETDPLANVDPRVFPTMKLKVGEIFIGPRNFGSWALNVDTFEQGARFTEIDGLIKKLNVKGDVTWIKPVKKDGSMNTPLPQTTEASLLLTSNDVGGIQKSWRMKPAVEAEYGKINTNLKWAGSPADPSISSLAGDLSIHLKDGRFIEAGDAGSLSAFGLLNFSAIGRRLRLDFSDVYESGFHFDYVKGRTRIDDGIIKVVDTLEIDGPSAKFASSGTVNLNTKELNQELSATFPITGTLPLMAIIAGFAPPVAASLFVGERLVGEEIEKFTSATYKLTGTWNEPKLDLMKRFDNDIEGKQDRSFWYRMKDFFGVGDN